MPWGWMPAAIFLMGAVGAWLVLEILYSPPLSSSVMAGASDSATDGSENPETPFVPQPHAIELQRWDPVRVNHTRQLGRSLSWVREKRAKREERGSEKE